MIAGGKPTHMTKPYLRHINQWNRTVISLFWILLTALALMEIFLVLLYLADPSNRTRAYFGSYLINNSLPAFLTVLITVLGAQILFYQIKNLNPVIQARWLLMALIIVVSEIAILHRSVSAISALYLLPVLISAFYIDTVALYMSYLLSLMSHITIVSISAFIRVLSPQLRLYHMIKLFSTTALISIAFLVARMIFRHVKELIHMAEEQDRRELELTHKLQLDSLTHLYNHATFYEKLDQAIMNYQQKGSFFSIIIMDLDNFKSVNDTYGHDIGNVVLLKLVSIINSNLHKDDKAFRYGGEEFAVISTHTDEILQVAECIRSELAGFKFKEFDRKITVSMGICTYDKSFGGRREFFSAADKALYQAKRSGKNKVRVALSGVTSGGYIPFDRQEALNEQTTPVRTG